jgi:flavin reductase (DIM6/NTAB) family NADH-FMN oxidoreductase RutF
METFKTLRPEQFGRNPFTMISKEWLLITAESGAKTPGAENEKPALNTMTASWGGLGHIWGKYVVYFVIKPQRYTKSFVDAAANVSICVLPEEWRDTLNYLGTVSGRDEDKIAKARLTVCRENGVPYFAEAHTVFICKKLFAQPFVEASFLDPAIIPSMYPQKDFHTMYIAGIEKILVK